MQNPDDLLAELADTTTALERAAELLRAACRATTDRDMREAIEDFLEEQDFDV